MKFSFDFQENVTAGKMRTKQVIFLFTNSFLSMPRVENYCFVGTPTSWYFQKLLLLFYLRHLHMKFSFDFQENVTAGKMRTKQVIFLFTNSFLSMPRVENYCFVGTPTSWYFQKLLLLFYLRHLHVKFSFDFQENVTACKMRTKQVIFLFTNSFLYKKMAQFLVMNDLSSSIFTVHRCLGNPLPLTA